MILPLGVALQPIRRDETARREVRSPAAFLRAYRAVL
jgi:hypothetical protein